ncbi:MAG: hypothetical protein II198_06080, partial [Bacteroidaceae bacterium]|nr:hypothetical protein [Bacteroidaceae bacterium]
NSEDRLHSLKIKQVLFTRLHYLCNNNSEDRLHSLKIKQVLFTRLHYLCKELRKQALKRSIPCIDYV